MLVAFRVDASLTMGTGHTMRCLTLADELARRGHQCHFVHRQQPGDLAWQIEARGHTLHRLIPIDKKGDALGADAVETMGEGAPHDDWLGCSWQSDAQQTRAALAPLAPGWLIVDHYALDAGWESAVAKVCGKTMVIDDLADRSHRCDLLLDQSFGRKARDYAERVPDHCRILVGPEFALLRPEFGEWRARSLARRRELRWPLNSILITMGGVDKENVTGKVLGELAASRLPVGCSITVVMGGTAPWREHVRAQASKMPYPTEVVEQVSDLAKRMAEADLALGAAGSTSWERCCLGLPSIMVVLAANQHFVAKALAEQGAAALIGEIDDIPVRFQTILSQALKPGWFAKTSASASGLCDGQGCARVVRQLLA